MARAGATEAADGGADGRPGSAGSAPEAIYASYSNEALTALAAEWDTLDVHQRRALLTEVRQRMAQKGSQPGSGVIQIRTERRYGRIIRQPDGRVIRIETQIVHVRPVSEAALAGRSGGYGVGFERRVGSVRQERPGVTASAPTPAVPAVEPASAPAAASGGTVKPFGAPVLQSVP